MRVRLKAIINHITSGVMLIKHSVNVIHSKIQIELMSKVKLLLI